MARVMRAGLILLAICCQRRRDEKRWQRAGDARRTDGAIEFFSVT